MRFKDLNEQQVLAVAITAEEEDAHIYRDFAESLRRDFPASAELFLKMAEEEDIHRHRLIDLYRSKFGEHSVGGIATASPRSVSQLFVGRIVGRKAGRKYCCLFANS